MKISVFLYAFSYYIVTFIFLPYIFITLSHFLHFTGFHNSLLKILGIVLIFIGVSNSMYSYVVFFLKGKGTPVPTQPTKKLIVDGFYKYTRNPIYLSHFFLTVGIYLFFGYPLLILYCVLFALWVHFYTLHEEKELKKRFGDEYTAYIKIVPRYFPKF